AISCSTRPSRLVLPSSLDSSCASTAPRSPTSLMRRMNCKLSKYSRTTWLSVTLASSLLASCSSLLAGGGRKYTCGPMPSKPASYFAITPVKSTGPAVWLLTAYADCIKTENKIQDLSKRCIVIPSIKPSKNTNKLADCMRPCHRQPSPRYNEEPEVLRGKVTRLSKRRLLPVHSQELTVLIKLQLYPIIQFHVVFATVAFPLHDLLAGKIRADILPDRRGHGAVGQRGGSINALDFALPVKIQPKATFEDDFIADGHRIPVLHGLQ